METLFRMIRMVCIGKWISVLSKKNERIRLFNEPLIEKFQEVSLWYRNASDCL